MPGREGEMTKRVIFLKELYKSPKGLFPSPFSFSEVVTLQFHRITRQADTQHRAPTQHSLSLAINKLRIHQPAATMVPAQQKRHCLQT